MQNSMTPADQMSALLPLYALYSSTSGATYLHHSPCQLCCGEPLLQTSRMLMARAAATVSEAGAEHSASLLQDSRKLPEAAASGTGDDRKGAYSGVPHAVLHMLFAFSSLLNLHPAPGSGGTMRLCLQPSS